MVVRNCALLSLIVSLVDPVVIVHGGLLKMKVNQMLSLTTLVTLFCLSVQQNCHVIGVRHVAKGYY